MKSAPLRLFALLCGCALFTGCPTVPSITGVKVTLVGFRPVESPAADTQAIMTVRFTSESMTATGFSGGSYKIYLNHEYLGKAEHAPAVGIPPMGTVTQDVLLNVDNPAAIRRGLAVADQALYRLESTLFYDDAGNPSRLKSVDEGKVDLHGLEPAAR